MFASFFFKPPVYLPPPVALVALAVLVALGGCNLHALRAHTLERQNRWEEAAIEFHLASLEDPEDTVYREGLARANKAVARENLVLYKTFLGQKQFGKAFQRLSDAQRQDPLLSEAVAEGKKWLRVLVAGQVRFEFESLRANLSLADQISLVARINTPNPGEVIEAEIDLNSGAFFAENLLYDRPSQMLAFYTLNSIGVRFVFSRGRTRQFSSRSLQRFVTFRTPVLEGIRGDFNPNGGGAPQAVTTHQGRGADLSTGLPPWQPPPNPHYSLEIRGPRILVSAAQGQFHFTPRFLYLNRKDRRMFVDFGGYRLSQHRATQKWGLARIGQAEGDYFPAFSQNIALQPYFFYRGEVYFYAPAGAG